MSALKVGLAPLVRVHKLEQQVRRLRAEMRELERQLRLVRRGRAGLAGWVAGTPQFRDWLLMQDLSSVPNYVSVKKIQRISIEDRSDVELAMLFLAASGEKETDNADG